jgi:multiple sugar transport system ATP-binding protein
MSNGQVQQVGTPIEVYNYPANEFVAGFLGSPPMNFIDVQVHQEGDSLSVDVDDLHWQTDLSNTNSGNLKRLIANRTKLAGSLKLGIRPEDISLQASQIPESIAGKVVLVEPMGSMNVVLIFAGNQKLTVTTGPDLGFQSGDNVFIHPNSAKVHFFDPETGNNVSLLS